jgi:hypothetical protein
MLARIAAIHPKVENTIAADPSGMNDERPELPAGGI